MSQPAIDVIVPCYNYGHYLSECVGSVLADSGLLVRVLIIDDASPDGSGAEAERIAANDPRVQVIRHAVNRGHIATYNEGIDWVEAPYMLLLSADDMVAPGALSRAVDLMERHRDIAFVYGEAVRFSTLGELPSRFASAIGEVTSGHDFIRWVCADPVNPVETATAVVRTSVQKTVGGYRPELPHSGDMEMWLRCAAHGDVGFISTTQAFVRMHATNMRYDYYGEDFVADYLQRHEAFRLFFRDFANRVPDSMQLQRRARSLIAVELLRDTSWRFFKGLPYRRGLTAAAAIDPFLWLRRANVKLALKAAVRTAIGERGWHWLRAFKARRRDASAASQIQS